MQDTLTPEAWKVMAAARRGKTFKDFTAMGVMKFISIHAFETANGLDWPNQHMPELFGVCRTSGHTYRVCRNLHGFNIIFAAGRLLPAHVARLSDMVEHVFGKYRLETARAKWNFSAEGAAKDIQNEKKITTALLEMEKVLLEKGVIPPAELMPAIRDLGAPRNLVARSTALAAMQKRLDEVRTVLDDTIVALEIKIEEIDSRLNALEKISCATSSNECKV